MLHRLPAIGSAATALACSVAAVATLPTGQFAEITKVERDFAAMSLTDGLKRSFLHYAAPDGVIFRPGPVPAVPTLSQDPDSDGDVKLDWWPAVGTIARSGDLAYSSGPWVLTRRNQAPRFGYYMTVWRRQADGSWRFVVDGAGGRIDAPPVRNKGIVPVMLPIAAAGKRDGATAALEDVRFIEDILSDAMSLDARSTLRSALDSKAWLLGTGKEPGDGGASRVLELASRPARMTLEYQGGGASAAGDLAYTYGKATSLDPRRPLESASYIHVWQRHPGGWKILFQGLKSGR